MTDDVPTFSIGLVDYKPPGEDRDEGHDEGQDVTLTVEPKSAGHFAYVEGPGGLVWNDTVGSDFFDSQTEVGRAGNSIRDRLEMPNAAAETVKENFRRACDDLAEAVEDLAAEIQSDDVARVLDMTERVVKFEAKEGGVTVHLEHDGNHGSVEFDPGEWLAGSPIGKLQQAIFIQVGPRVDLYEGDWPVLVDEWEADMEVIREEQTGADQVVQQVAGDVQRLGKPVADRADWGNSTHTMWYEPDADDFGGEDVLWVRSRALMDYLENTSKSENWLPQLSRGLQEGGFTFSTSKQARVSGTPESVYPFRPGMVGIDREDLPETGDGGPEVEP